MLMELLPVEMLNEILLQVDKSTLFDAAQVCKQWRHLALKQVVPIKIYQHFKRACRIDDRLSIIGSKCVKSWINEGFATACATGQQKLVQLLITQGANDWNRGLGASCRGGHEVLVRLMITRGANDWNWALTGACRSGRQELVQLMITKGANNWNGALYYACAESHQDIVQLMISKGANHCGWCKKSLALH